MSRKFLIVDDEKNSRDYLEDLIREYDSGSQIVGSAANASEALKLAKEQAPEVIFLDIKMPGTTGMELLDNLKDRERFKIVFTTAYSEYAIRAIREEAFDYLLKPIDKEEFFAMMRRLEEVLQTKDMNSNNAEEYEQASIAIYHNNGFRLIKLSDIAYIEASNNYSNIRLSRGGSILVSRPLKEFENRLNKRWFFRIHKSYIINMHYVKEYVTEDGGKVILQNNEEIYVSKYKLHDFFEFISRLTNGLKAKFLWRAMWLLVLQVLWAKAYSQYYPLRRYSVTDGLSHSNVFRIMQDEKGFIWLSTNYGISCFNGKSFKNYSSAQGLRDNVIMSISELRDGSKAICSFHGLHFLANDSIQYNEVLAKQLPEKVIYSLEALDKLWVIGMNSIYELYTVKGDKATRIHITNEAGKELSVSKFIKDEVQGIIFLTEDGLFTCNSTGKIVPFLRQLVRGKIHCCRRDKQGNYWIGLDEQLICVNKDRILYTYSLDFKAGVGDLIIDKNNDVWAAIPQLGVVLVHDGKPRNITSELGLKKIIINHLFEDNEGSIWIATHGDGIYRVSTLNTTIYYPEENKLNVYAKGFCEWKGRLFVGSIGTVGVLQGERFQALRLKYLLSTDYIYFLRVQGDELYVGIPRGLVRKNLLTGAEAFIKSPGAISACELGKTLYIGSYTQIGVLKNGSYQSVDIKGLWKMRINSIAEGMKGELIIGTPKGIYSVREGIANKMSCGSYKNEFAVNQVFHDTKDRLWVATGNGLLVQDKGGWRLMGVKEGLDHEKCNAISEDMLGNIWIGTQKGLNMIDPAYRVTQHSSGLDPYEILMLYNYGRNQLTIGTVNGMSIRHEMDDEISIQPPKLYIVRAVTEKKAIEYPEHVVVGSGEAKVSISFIGLSYKYADNIEYRYQILPAGEQWTETKNNVVDLSLTSGDYTFVLQAKMNGGPWGHSQMTSITVTKAFWQEWWFIAALVMTAVVLLLLISSYRIRVKERQARADASIQSKMVMLRQQALNALINPHFIFNCLNSIQHYINKNDRDSANKYLASFGKLIRLTLDHSNDSFISLKEEILRMTLYLELEKLRCGERLKYSIEWDEALNRETLVVPNMVIQPYVENAIWHGIVPMETEGKLTVKFCIKDNESMNVVVEDNGRGIELNSGAAKISKTSYGMSLTRERLELLNQTSAKKGYDVNVVRKKDPNETGTVVTLTFPLQTASGILNKSTYFLNKPFYSLNEV